MLERALKRLFLILFPMGLLWLALFLTNNKPAWRDSAKPPFSKKETKISSLLESKCPFYLGISFFPVEEKKQNLWTSPKPFPSPPFRTFLLSKKSFVKKLNIFKKEFKKENFSFEKAIFAFPLVLTKNGKWLISKKTFFILPTGERKELSHLTYSEIKNFHTDFTQEKVYSPLKLETVFSYLPDKNFLFYLEGSDRDKIIEKLEKNLKSRTKGQVYLSSSNEKLLEEILALGSNWKVLHSFKSLVRFQIMNILHLGSFKNFPGKGFIIPSLFSFSSESLSFFQNQKKLLFFEKDPPYDSLSQTLIQNTQALISSKPKQALSIVKIKKPCLIKK